MEYEPVIGMEVHAQLLTKSKMFCCCSADYAGAPPNTHVCPVCLGMPGSLPVINRKAVEYTIMTALALNCEIAPCAVHSRKSYFYPDLPKNYQISMYDLPLSHDGWLEVEADEKTKRIGIERVHLEEDTAKLIHVGDHSLVDFNRSGVPLMEIVTKPNIRSPEEARQYLIKLRTILRYLGVSSGDMEKGAMRCEANISLRPLGSTEMGTRVEVKNLNSFRAVKLALEHEIERQARILDAGGHIEQETMGWDEDRGVTVVQRIKEYAHDYRYFPEPDLPPLTINREWVDGIKGQLPELPDTKRDRFIEEHRLSRYDAGVLVTNREVAEYFEECVKACTRKVEPKAIANWMTGELFRLMKERGMEIGEVKVRPENLVSLIALVNDGAINISTAKDVFAEMFETGRGAQKIVEDKGLAQISDVERLSRIIDEVIAENPGPMAEYLGGKKKVLTFLIGQVMKATRGKANPRMVNELLLKRLKQNRNA